MRSKGRSSIVIRHVASVVWLVDGCRVVSAVNVRASFQISGLGLGLGAYRRTIGRPTPFKFWECDLRPVSVSFLHKISIS
jgi:hypothetical protein